jgi:hypothetical protein
MFAQQPEFADKKIISKGFAREFARRFTRFAYCLVQRAFDIVRQADCDVRLHRWYLEYEVLDKKYRHIGSLYGRLSLFK